MTARAALLLLATAIAAGCGSSTPSQATGPTPPAVEPTPDAAPAAETPPAKPEIPDGNMARADIPDKYKWNLTDLMADDATFEKTLTEVAARRAEIDKCRGTLAKPARLFACLDLYFKTRLTTNKLTLYANLRANTDQVNPKLQDMYQRAQAAMRALMAQAAVLRTEILTLSPRALKTAYKKEPKLTQYRPYLDEILRRKPSVLDAEAERVLSLVGDNQFAEIDLNELPSDFELAFGGMMSDLPLPEITDDKGAKVQMTVSNYPVFRASPDRRIRRDAVEGFFATLNQFRDLYAGLLAGQIHENVAFARARGFATALDAYLFRDDIDPAIYKNLITSVEANLEPLHRYVRLRKKVMGVDELHIYDLYTPLVPGVDKKIPYREATKIVAQALAPLGDDYLEVLEKGLDPKNGWVDVYPNKDKESGAFSTSVYGVHPYVKMNYFDDLDSVSTLAHEFGHALHTYEAMSHQPYVTEKYVMPIAETASTFNQKLLSDYLIAHATSDDEKLYLLNDLVETIRTTIYRQTLFAAFELAAHTAAENGTPLTAEFLDKTYADLIRKYYGPDFTVGQNDGMEWAYIPHFYYKYYVFSYAVGLSSGIALAEKVQTGGPAARDAYLSMLAGGCSKPPRELFLQGGVDVTKPDAVVAAAKLMDSALSQMEEILARRAE